jgi:hypothetical protein
MLLAANEAPMFEYIPSMASQRLFTRDWYDWGLSAYGLPDNTNVIKCAKCKKYYMEEELFPIVALDKSTKFFCPDCIVDAAWCNECGSAYEKYCPEAPNTGTCPICIELKGGKINGDRSTVKN